MPLIESATLLGSTSLAFLLNTANLSKIVSTLIYNPVVLKPIPLFFSSISIWLGNVLVFTLVYWLIDRGGPDGRAAGTGPYPDFLFPVQQDPNAPRNWQPNIVDYLFIGFTTNTAFSPTEAMPVSGRAKALVILQSCVSLVTIAVVAARAIGVLPS